MTVSPKLGLDFGYGELEQAIVCRSLTHLDHILHRDLYITPVDWPNNRLSPVELAVGWPTGLRRLLNAGWPADQGLFLSVDRKDSESIKIILAAGRFVNPRGTWDRVLRILAELVSKGLAGRVSRTYQALTRSLVSHRQTLKALATENLPQDETIKLGLLSKEILDSSAPAIYRELQKRRIRVLQLFDPVFPLDGADDYGSIYHTLSASYTYFKLSLLNLLYNAGFDEVDISDRHGETPLRLACRVITVSWYREPSALLIHWFLDKGACPTFACADPYPNVLFYVATIYAEYSRRDKKRYHRGFKTLVRRSTALCDPTNSDGCQCYCSSAGCLPVHKFWTCDSNQHLDTTCKSVDSSTLLKALYEWRRLCGMNEAKAKWCYKEICRREVFDRLGMAHTCCESHFCCRGLMCDGESVDRMSRTYCMGSYCPCNHRLYCVDRRDCDRLQEEDAESKKQLDLIMQAFQNRYRRYTGGIQHFMKSWMQDLEEILPDLLPQERCKMRCLRFIDYPIYRDSPDYLAKEKEVLNWRATREKEALAMKGYLGLDFIDVIRRHFADDLSPEPSESLDIS